MNEDEENEVPVYYVPLSALAVVNSTMALLTGWMITLGKHRSGAVTWRVVPMQETV